MQRKQLFSQHFQQNFNDNDNEDDMVLEPLTKRQTLDRHQLLKTLKPQTKAQKRRVRDDHYDEEEAPPFKRHCHRDEILWTPFQPKPEENRVKRKAEEEDRCEDNEMHQSKRRRFLTEDTIKAIEATTSHKWLSPTSEFLQYERDGVYSRYTATNRYLGLIHLDNRIYHGFSQPIEQLDSFSGMEICCF
jgi:hypothetical protein